LVHHSNYPNYGNSHPFLLQMQQYMNQWTTEHLKHMEELENRIRVLQEEQMSLKEQVGNLKQVHIENINYKIQELSVKELKGTLNIGMTALTDPEEIKKWLDLSQGDGDVQLRDMSNPESQPDPLPDGHDR
jgi:spore germination protein PC